VISLELRVLYNDEYETTIYPYNEGTVLFKFLLNSISQTIITNLKNEFNDYYKKQRKILKMSIENYHKYKDKYQLSFINLIENIKKNKIINNINGNKVKVSELNIDQDIKSKDKISTPCKISKIFNLDRFNNNAMNINNDNRILSARNDLGKTKNLNEVFPNIKNYNSQNESPKNLINYNSDKSSSYIKLKKDKSQNSNNKKNKDIRDDIKLNINNSNIRKVRSFSSLFKLKNNNLDKTKDKFSFLLYNDKLSFFFNENRTDNLISFRKFDNNYNSNNSNNAFPKNNIIKLKSNKNEINNYLLPLSSRNSLRRSSSVNKGNDKVDNQLPNKDKISSEKSEKCIKSKKKLHIFEKHGQQSYYNSSNNVDFQMPLMIIRNVSFNPKLK